MGIIPVPGRKFDAKTAPLAARAEELLREGDSFGGASAVAGDLAYNLIPGKDFALEATEEALGPLSLAGGDLPFILGGNHYVALGALNTSWPRPRIHFYGLSTPGSGVAAYDLAVCRVKFPQDGPCVRKPTLLPGLFHCADYVPAWDWSFSLLDPNVSARAFLAYYDGSLVLVVGLGATMGAGHLLDITKAVRRALGFLLGGIESAGLVALGNAKGDRLFSLGAQVSTNPLYYLFTAPPSWGYVCNCNPEGGAASECHLPTLTSAFETSFIAEAANVEAFNAALHLMAASEGDLGLAKLTLACAALETLAKGYSPFRNETGPGSDGKRLRSLFRCPAWPLNVLDKELDDMVSLRHKYMHGDLAKQVRPAPKGLPQGGGLIDYLLLHRLLAMALAALAGYNGPVCRYDLIMADRLTPPPVATAYADLA